ncbi:hypothetical protein CGZ94_18240 [Enemella evansiae]|uniref:Uncharacterized protein n=1 Tax=Enemella evansiae TaxID=2016499 RepID=A0A255G0Z8_9ACTN|nr:hypothetical protein [Enemella evansiae]OYO09599.1 hypothetical protein CGZ94_18240 [Enemella evansiae]
MSDDETTRLDPTVPPAPRTGHDQVDGVLAELDGLADQPVAEHHDRLARAHEALHGVLSDESSDSGAQGSA